MPRKPSTSERLTELKRLARGKERALIVLQNNPDPDAIASAAALKLLLKKLAGCDAVIAHGGIVGRAENRSMLKYLGTAMRNLVETPIDGFELVAMVDTQPGFGNNPISNKDQADIVIDHHHRAGCLHGVKLCDVRPRYGATSTILTQYLRAAGITPPTALATALAYGIQSDTQDLGRETSSTDIEAFTYLYPLANKRLLSRIDNEREPREYFGTVARALFDARTYKNTAVCWLGRIINPDMTGEISDLLVRLDEADWALCQGLYKGTLHISLRTDFRNADANGVMKTIIRDHGTGGGHEMIAGGQIDVPGDRLALANRLRYQVERNFLAHFKLSPRSRRLLVTRTSKHGRPSSAQE